MKRHLLLIGLLVACDDRPQPAEELDLSRALDLAGIGKMKKVADATNESLQARTKNADRIVVREMPDPKLPVLFESRTRSDIDALRGALAITPPNAWNHCMCIGGPAIQFWRGEELLVELTVHHGTSIRTSIWSTDAELAEREKLLAWFDARGMPGPREEVEEDELEAEESARQWRRWTAAVPAPLESLWQERGERLRSTGAPPELPPWREALARGLPDPGERILALLTWFGSGDGPWRSGFATYEMVPAKLLREYPVATILETLEGSELTEAQREGAARLLAGGWIELDPAALSKELKERLLRHGTNSTIPENREMAQRAFGT